LEELTKANLKAKRASVFLGATTFGKSDSNKRMSV
jgi:hypothetical protein